MNSFTTTPQTLPPAPLGNFPLGCVTADPATPGRQDLAFGSGWLYPDNGPTVYRDSAGTTPIKLSTQAAGTTVYSNAATLGASPYRGGPTYCGETYQLTRLS